MCRKKRLSVQAKAASQAEPSTVPPVMYEVLRSPGQPLDTTTRTFMEARFDHDFSRVRVHTDTKAAESARAVNALAYTVGQDMVFGAGQYRPGTAEGRRLMAHELVHTIQQSEVAVPRPKLASLKVSEAGDASEQEADRLADRVMGGGVAVPVPTRRINGMARLQRQTRQNEQNGGCGVCTSAALVGTLAHTLTETMFKLVYGRRVIPEAPFYNPQDQENNRLDLMRIIQSSTPPTIIEIGEIKPDNDQGRKDGKRDLEFYKRAVQTLYPGPFFEVHFMELPAPQVSVPFTDAPQTQCPVQQISIRGTKLGGQPGLYLYGCTPPRSQINQTCCGTTIPVPVTSEADEKEKEKSKPSLSPAPTGQSVPVSQPSMSKQIVDLIKRIVQTGADVEQTVGEFLKSHPEIVDYIYFSVATIFIANILEDIFTLGAGLADEPIVISICLTMIRIARAMRAAALVPATAL